MQTNGTQTQPIATLTEDLRAHLRACLTEAMEEGLYGDHAGYLETLDQLKLGTDIWPDDHIADALFYFAIVD